MSEQHASRYMAWFERKKKKDPEWWQKRMHDNQIWVMKKKTKDANWEEQYRIRRRNALKRWKKNNPERNKEITKRSLEKQRREHPEKHILMRVKTRAKSRGIDFDLEVSDIIIPETCPILGIPIVAFPPNGLGEPGCASVDRIDPSKGYIKGNIQIISGEANRIKNNCYKPEVFRAIADYIEGHTRKII